MVVEILPSNAKTLLGLFCNSNCIHLCSRITLSFSSNLNIVKWLMQGRNQLFISGRDDFHEISFDYVIVVIHRGRTFSQTVTYNNNVFLPADTKSIVQTHTFCTKLV